MKTKNTTIVKYPINDEKNDDNSFLYKANISIYLNLSYSSFELDTLRGIGAALVFTERQVKHRLEQELRGLDNEAAIDILNYVARHVIVACPFEVGDGYRRNVHVVKRHGVALGHRLHSNRNIV